MIEINIQTDDSAWIAKLSTTIKGKIHEKEIKGISNDKLEILDTIFTTIKSKKEFTILTNNEEIKFLLEEKGFPSQIIEKSFDFSEINNYKEIENPDMPEYLNRGFKDICIYDKKEENQIAVSTHFVKAYMFFQENSDKIKEIKLLKDLKDKGVYQKDTLMEDILQIIEETFIN